MLGQIFARAQCQRCSEKDCHGKMQCSTKMPLHGHRRLVLVWHQPTPLSRMCGRWPEFEQAAISDEDHWHPGPLPLLVTNRWPCLLWSYPISFMRPMSFFHDHGSTSNMVWPVGTTSTTSIQLMLSSCFQSCHVTFDWQLRFDWHVSDLDRVIMTRERIKLSSNLLKQHQAKLPKKLTVHLLFPQ